MRVLLLLLPLVLAGCIPAGRGPARGGFNPDKDIRQCLVDLSRAGAKFTPLPDRQFGGGCSATGAVKLVAIGVPVANLGAIKCRTAERLTLWVNGGLQAAAQEWLGSRVVKLDSFGTYACRPVNGKAGAKLSQHGLANAVDIAAFTLADGRRVAVKTGWRAEDAQVRGFLRAAFKAGCRRFNVAIGPDGDAYHQDHFHFDMGPAGGYCR